MSSWAVLVIEDDPEMLEVLVDSLQDQGYITHGAASADGAFELGARHTYDQVISDVRMAGSRDGIGAIEVLKQRKPTLRCIVITGFANDQAPVRAIKLAVDDYVFKPFKLPEFLRTVERVLEPPTSSYKSLLKSILSTPRRLLEKADMARREAAARVLQGERERCLHGFYVAIRSNLLTRGAALEVWDRLEGLDDLEPADLAAHTEAYRRVLEWMTNLTNAKSVGQMNRRDETKVVERRRFLRFYERIQGGKVLFDHVAVAAFLRREGFNSANEEVRQMAELVWA